MSEWDSMKIARVTGKSHLQVLKFLRKRCPDLNGVSPAVVDATTAMAVCGDIDPMFSLATSESQLSEIRLLLRRRVVNRMTRVYIATDSFMCAPGVTWVKIGTANDIDATLHELRTLTGRTLLHEVFRSAVLPVAVAVADELLVANECWGTSGGWLCMPTEKVPTLLNEVGAVIDRHCGYE